jgi:hypothetical protein
MIAMSSKKYSARFLKGARTFRVTPAFETEVIEEYLSSLDCPRSLMIWLLYRNGEHEQIAGLGFDPLDYDSMAECRDAYAATKFLSKFKGLTLDRDLDEVAMQKFDEFELLCRSTNKRFQDLSRDLLFRGPVVRLHGAVVRKIDKILGAFDAEEFFSMPDWGPGASTLIKRRDASSVKKFQCETGITRDLFDLVPFEVFEGAYPLWSRRLREAGFPTFQTGNKVITVPKDASTNRVIAVEPGINLWFQSSIGDMVGKRLLRRGIDLRFQERNQELARLGSINNRLATVDLSSASDSIARAVVEELLPPRWYHVMDACRSHYGSRNGQVKKWEKFSSMGNGFTFQLETLIFYAVALCCTEYLHQETGAVSAYGDDVIIPSACYELFSRMMDFYGFRVNGKKSHTDSPFRESCGAHWYRGVDVKPIYLKDRVSSVLSIYRLANAVRRLSHRRMFLYGCDSKLRGVFDLLFKKVPAGLRLLVPDGKGDGGFVVNFDEATPSRARNGIEGYHYRALSEVSHAYYDETEGYLLASLWSLRSQGDETLWPHVGASLLGRGYFRYLEGHARSKAIGGWIVERELEGRNSVPLHSQLRLRLSRGLAQQWYDLGPWL